MMPGDRYDTCPVCGHQPIEATYSRSSTALLYDIFEQIKRTLGK
jgi:hypothetical protein